VEAHRSRIRDYLGLMYEEIKAYDKAIEAYETNLKIQPTYVDGHLHMGFLFYRLKRTTDAVSHLIEAVKLNPKQPDAHLLLGLTYLQNEQYPLASQAFEQGILYNPDNPDLHFNLGTAYDKMDRFDDVVHAMESALRLDPKHAEALNYLGYSYAERGIKIPRDLHITPLAIPIGTQMLHATGLAWAARYRKEDSIACTFFGDGATSEGDFHEAANFAANLDIPVIFFCQNNGWAISVPAKIQCSAPTVAQRGIAYGMDCVQVDGNDLFAVVKAVKDSAANARKKKRPTFIEAVTYRMSVHTTADDPKKLIDIDEYTRHLNTMLEQLTSYSRQVVVISETPFGPIEPLLRDPTVSEIMVNGPDIVFVEQLLVWIMRSREGVSHAIRLSLSIRWNRSRLMSCNAGFSRRISFILATRGARLAFLSRSHVLISYFSEFRYSSDPGSRGVCSMSSNAGP
jgi:Flp pilus assembly protein TadD